MKLFSKATYYTYQTTYLFSLVVVGWGDVLAMGSLSNERDIWKSKCVAMERKCSMF